MLSFLFFHLLVFEFDSHSLFVQHVMITILVRMHRVFFHNFLMEWNLSSSYLSFNARTHGIVFSLILWLFFHSFFWEWCGCKTLLFIKSWNLLVLSAKWFSLLILYLISKVMLVYVCEWIKYFALEWFVGFVDHENELSVSAHLYFISFLVEGGMYQGIDGSMLTTYTPPEVPKRAKLRRKRIFIKLYCNNLFFKLKKLSLKWLTACFCKPGLTYQTTVIPMKQVSNFLYWHVWKYYFIFNKDWPLFCLQMLCYTLTILAMWLNAMISPIVAAWFEQFFGWKTRRSKRSTNADN